MHAKLPVVDVRRMALRYVPVTNTNTVLVPVVLRQKGNRRSRQGYIIINHQGSVDRIGLQNI